MVRLSRMSKDSSQTKQSKTAKYIHKLDHHDVIEGRSIYDVPFKTLVWKNFIAGMSRAAGGLLFFTIFFVILGLIAAHTLWPPIQDFVETFQKTSLQLKYTNKMIHELNETINPGEPNGFLPEFEIPTFEQLFNQVKENNQGE
jgi:hypothetical protein